MASKLLNILKYVAELHTSELKYLPTHSIRLICLATVLWTRNGKPDPLPDVHEWFNKS